MPVTRKLIIGGTLTLTLDEPATRPGCLVTLTYGGFTITARSEDMAYKLPDDKTVQVRVSFVDAKGHAAQVDGGVEWASSDENVATVEADENDSTMAVITPGDQLGQVQITATADADLGEGSTEIIAPMDVEIVSGTAVAGTISPVGAAGEPGQPQQ